MPGPKAEGLVFRLESRIYKASRQNDHGKQNAGTPKEANGWNTDHIDRYIKQICKLLIAKIFFYMAETLEDTNIMRRAV
jgi:hypothetical protein